MDNAYTKDAQNQSPKSPYFSKMAKYNHAFASLGLERMGYNDNVLEENSHVDLPEKKQKLSVKGIQYVVFRIRNCSQTKTSMWKINIQNAEFLCHQDNSKLEVVQQNTK